MISWPDVPNRFAGRCVLCHAKVETGAGVAVHTSGHGHKLICNACAEKPDGREEARRLATEAFLRWKAARDASPYAECFICGRRRLRSRMEYLAHVNVYRCWNHAAEREATA